MAQLPTGQWREIKAVLGCSLGLASGAMIMEGCIVAWLTAS